MRKHYALVALQIVVALFLFALFLSLYKYTERMLVQQCDEKATREMERIQLTIQREMTNVEGATMALSALVFGHGTYLPTDSVILYRRLEQFLATMPPSITGAIAGFEDGVMPEQYNGPWGYIPLVRHTDSTFVRYQLGRVRDVRQMHDWYRETKRLDRPRWAKPQRSEDGEVICGYCVPMHDAEGRFVGVLSIDFSLDRLAQDVCALRPYEHAEPFVTDHDFTILMALDHSLVLNHTMLTMLQKRGLEFEEEILDNVRAAQPGKYHILQGDFRHRHEVFFYHMPEPHTGWTIQMTCPAADVTQALHALRYRMAVIAIALGALILLVALTFLRHHSE